MFRRLRQRHQWKFSAVLPKAEPSLAVAWWIALLLRGVLPAVLAIAMGVLVGAVQRGGGLSGALTLVGATFVLLQVLDTEYFGGTLRSMPGTVSMEEGQL